MIFRVLVALGMFLASGSLEAASVLIEGYVFDRDTRRAIDGLNVRVDETAHGMTTDKRGRFSFRLAQGEYTLIFSRVGYPEYRRPIAVADASHPVIYIEMTMGTIDLDEIEVQAQRAETRFDDLHQTTGQLSGDDLQRQYSATLAETIKNQTGIAIRSMGPAPARPVVRGLGGDRVHIYSDGVKTRDLSATSSDHAVTLDPFNVERIDIVRGPRTLLYGSTAVGGVVNVVTHKIPEALPERVFGSAGAFGETANRGYLSSVALTAPVGPVALYGEAAYRDTRHIHTPRGALGNTPIHTRTYTLGASYPTPRGYIGASFDQFDTRYGIPGGFIGAHPNGVDIEMLRRAFTGKAIYQPGHAVWDDLELHLSHTFYHHFEYESNGSLGAEFLFHDYAGDLRLHFNTPAGRRSTTLGLNAGHHTLKFGGFVFTPPTRTRTVSSGLYHQQSWRSVELQMALRYTYAHFDPRPNVGTRIGSDVDRTFHAWSAAFSPLVPLGDRFTLGFGLSRSARVPTLEELYNEGPHLAAYTYEVGNVALDTEKSFGLESFVFYKRPGLDAVLTGFWTAFQHYITPRNTGEINFAQLLPIYAADGVAARFLGCEAHVGWRPFDRWEWEATASYVRGQNRTDGLPLPEIPPLKGSGRIAYRHRQVTIGVGAEIVAAQRRVDAHESYTDGYAVFRADAQKDWITSHTRHSVVLSVENLFNSEYRNHLSRVRSVMPEAGRNVKLHYKLFFF